MRPQHESPVEHLSDTEWAELSGNAQAVLIELLDEVRQLKQQVSQLQEQVRRNSRNSSQPPSQDKPMSKQQRGGQAGHAG